MASTTAQQLQNLLDELDDESLSKLSDEEIIKMRQQLNPYGRTIQGSDKVLTYSYTDLRKSYLERLLVTSMIGYLNRMCDEWNVPSGIPVIPVYDYVKDPSKLYDFEKTLPDPEILRADLDKNKEYMEKRVIIKEFLEDMFQYNPDYHVRSAYKPNPKDEERQILDSPAAHLAIYQLKKENPEFKEAMLQYDRAKALRERGEKELKESEKTTELVPEVIKTKLTECATEMIPPADIFHRFKYYYESNYEELQGVVQNLYNEKSDLETALNPYAWHDNEDDADVFINKHKDEVITTIYKAHSGKWNISSPFKKVRESMRYFNKNTAVLEGIAKQIEGDAKIGRELMKKRIRVTKQKNIADAGPDDEAFLKWKNQNSTLKDMGAESINANSYASDDCPEDAIEVPVFRLSNGGTKLEKTKFYSKAEAPGWMEGQGAPTEPLQTIPESI